MDLGTTALTVVDRTVVVVDGSRLRNYRILGNLLVLSGDLSVSRADLIPRRRLRLVKSTIGLHSLIFVTFLDDIEAELSLGSISKVSESLSFRLLDFRTSAISSTSGNFSKHALGLIVGFSKSFLSNVVVRKTVSAFDSSEFTTHGRSSRRLFSLGLVLGCR